MSRPMASLSPRASRPPRHSRTGCPHRPVCRPPGPPIPGPEGDRAAASPAWRPGRETTRSGCRRGAEGVHQDIRAWADDRTLNSGHLASLSAPHGWPVPTTARERSYRHQARPGPVGQRAWPATRPPQRPRARRTANVVLVDGMVSESEFRRITELPSAENRAIFEELGAPDDPDHQERVASRAALVEWLRPNPDWGRATAWGGGRRS